MKTDTVENLGAVKSSEIIILEQEATGECGIESSLEVQGVFSRDPEPGLRLPTLRKIQGRAARRKEGGTQLYRHFDGEGRLLYVGVSFSVIARLADHARKSAWWTSVATITIDYFPSREEAELAEMNAIALEHPQHNRSRPFFEKIEWGTVTREEFVKKCAASGRLFRADPADIYDQIIRKIAAGTVYRGGPRSRPLSSARGSR